MLVIVLTHLSLVEVAGERFGVSDHAQVARLVRGRELNLQLKGQVWLPSHLDWWRGGH